MLKIKKIKPLANYIVTTKDVYTEEDAKDGTLLVKAIGSVKEYQKVVAVGPMVRSMKEGDVVFINPRRYAMMKHKEGSLKDGVITDNPVISYNIPTVEIDDVTHLFLNEQDIQYVVEEFEEVKEEKKPKIIMPKKTLIC